MFKVGSEGTVEANSAQPDAQKADQLPHFAWTGDLERTQADRYGPHIQSCITTPRDMPWIDAANSYPLLLETAKCSSLPFALKGTTHYAAVQRASIKARLPLTGLRALFALKKAVDSGEMSMMCAEVWTKSQAGQAWQSPCVGLSKVVCRRHSLSGHGATLGCKHPHTFTPASDGAHRPL